MCYFRFNKINMYFNRVSIIKAIVYSWNKNNKYNKDIFKIIISYQNLKKAWQEITPRFTAVLSRINIKPSKLKKNEFKNIHCTLKRRLYKFKLLRKINIPKANKVKIRPLFIIAWKDKIVQQAFKRILEICLEGIIKKKPVSYDFSFDSSLFWSKNYFKKSIVVPTYLHSSSNGFRPGRSRHTVLKRIKKFWKDVSFFININIYKVFTKGNRFFLFRILLHIFRDQRLVDDLRKMIQIGIINLNEHIINTEFSLIETTQNLKLAPLLLNIYLTKLDKFIGGIFLESSNKRKIDKKDTITKTGLTFLKTVKNETKKNLKRYITIINFRKTKTKKLFYLIQNGKQKYSYSTKQKSLIVYYIRYAENFLMGVNGTIKIAQYLLNRVTRFIEKKLFFNCSKTNLVHALSSWVEFLGFKLQFRSKGKIVLFDKKNEKVKRFQIQSALKAVRLKEKYFNIAVRLAKIAFFNRIHKYANTFQYFMSQEDLIKTGAGEADLSVFNFLKNRLYNTFLKKNIRKPKSFVKTQLKKITPSLKLKKVFSDIKLKKKRNSFTTLGRELRMFGNIQIENEGRKYIVKLLNSKVSIFHSCIEFEKDLNNNKLKRTKTRNGFKKKNLKKRYFQFKFRTFNIYIHFPKKEIMIRLKTKGIINSEFKPQSYAIIINEKDVNIINHFNNLSCGILNYYSPCNNFWDVRSIVTYHVRYALLATLGHKHKGNIFKAIKRYGKDPSTKISIRKIDNALVGIKPSSSKFIKKFEIRTKFISKSEISQKTRYFRIPKIGICDWGKLNKALLPFPLINKSLIPHQLVNMCAIKGCSLMAVQGDLRKFVIEYKNKFWDSKDKKQFYSYLKKFFFKWKPIPFCQKHSKIIFNLNSGIKSVDRNFVH